MTTSNSAMVAKLSFNECVSALKCDGHKVTHMFEGEPGIGKSALGKTVAAELGRDFVYLDIANMSLGDLMYPVPDRERKCMEFYPNEIFKLHEQKPCVIMLDEWTKGSKEVKNMTLPLVLERRLGSVPLHPETIVFSTGNMTRDGVGDSIQAHQKNRFTAVTMRKPTADEWIDNFALNNNVHPVVIAFVNEYPQVMESYMDMDETQLNENGYIFNPRKQQSAYVSPRSLQFGSDVIWTKDQKTVDTLLAQLTGQLGAAGAADLLNFVRMNEELPPLAAVIADPEGATLPTKPTNRLLLTFSLLVRSDKDNVASIIKYMSRMNNEMQALFMNKLLSTKSKAQWAIHVKEVGDATQRLHHVF